MLDMITNNDIDAGKPSPARQADWRFLLSHPAHWVALGLGAGLMRPGPGTWGTAVGWGLFALAFPAGTRDWSSVGLAIAVALVLGTWAAQRASLLLGEADPSVVVVDEIVAFWIVLALLPPAHQGLAVQACAFVVFRVFDITKPPPIRQIDRRWKNAWGIMADDLLAAAYTVLVVDGALALIAPRGGT
jgi:phosphatidylglycerophosphatase A